MANKKEQLLSEFESCLYDFWGGEPTKTGIKKAWKDYLDSVKENEEIPKTYYKLTKDEREKLYCLAGLM